MKNGSRKLELKTDSNLLETNQAINTYSINTILTIGQYLPNEEKKRFMDLNQGFYDTLITFFVDTFDDFWIGELDNKLHPLLERFGSHVKNINLSTLQNLSLHEFLFEHCPNVQSVKLGDCPVNDTLDLIFEYYDQIKFIELTNLYDDNPIELSQVPRFNQLCSLKLKRIVVNCATLNEVFYFVPETIQTFVLNRLAVIEDVTIVYFFTKYPKLRYLELIGEFFMETALLALDYPMLELNSLIIGEIGTLSRNSNKIKIKAVNFPSLKDLRISGWEDLADDGNRMTQLLSSSNYALSTLVFSNLNMDISYTFTAQRFPNLTYLSLDSCTKISIETITHIFTQLPNLEKLVLNNTSITDQHFSQLSKRRKSSPNLESPVKYLSICEIDKLGQHFLTFLITQLLHLTYLDVSNCTFKELTSNVFTTLWNHHLFPLSLHTLRTRVTNLSFTLLLFILNLSPHLNTIEVDEDLQVEELFEFRDTVRPKLEIFTDLEDDVEVFDLEFHCL